MKNENLGDAYETRGWEYRGLPLFADMLRTAPMDSAKYFSDMTAHITLLRP